ncbi:MAG: Stf0 sulfotransferase [Devosia sp.]|jgi:LPS sulfotransferase NodH|nr:Stf0 sulfotransferase [Devosia sp.]
MHLVIVSTPRSGAHMLRSMLRADGSIDDLGAFIFPDDGQVIEPPANASGEAVQAVYERELAARPGRTLVSHIKLMHGHFEAIRAAAATGGRFMLLRRVDRLAEACSLILAMKYRAIAEPAPAGSTISPEPKQVRDMVAEFGRLEELGRRYLEGLPFVSLDYEDISVPTVKAASASLGLDLDVGEPTTQKSAPRLADFVTNLSELI